MPIAEPPFQRFLRNFEIDPSTKCWNWKGQLGSSGYGQIKCWGKMVSAHRLAHELYNGPIPNGLHVLHSCDNKLCVNPAHLSCGTRSENIQQAIERGLIKTGLDSFLFGRESKSKGIRSSQSKPVMVLGKFYGSMNEAEKDLNLGHGSVRYWIKSNSHKARYLTDFEIEEERRKHHV